SEKLRALGEGGAFHRPVIGRILGGELFGGFRRRLAFGFRRCRPLGGFGGRARRRGPCFRSVLRPCSGTFGSARPRPRRWRSTLGSGVEQGDGLLKRDGLRGLVARQGGIHASVAHVGTVAAVLGDDGPTLGRMVAKRAAR